MFPGYKLVESFGADAEYEEGVEVEYVTLDLGNNVNRELIPHTSEFRLVGLDTDTPLLQLGETFFRGVHEELIGTELLFTDGRDESNLSRKFVVPVATTERRIKFEQVEVKGKAQEGELEMGVQRDSMSGTSKSGVTERAKEKRRGSEREGSKKGKGRVGAESGKGMAHGEMILDLDTPLSGIL